ncbi:chromatin structure-remodeling complex protein BSH isoform X1 [Populus alba x Populus x berolinensis]|uniref:Chromatin structure-remodeling complex protein BSH isoform X1 n=1 Tax=Populus alba x Populus x berolinensis TaxID=444605 RepID=A0AAD6M8D9_9ROSI|nr:chromatin structure-remodeling complex protein BSH isoform X1 [Populus alba x Populus x berolinensis]
MKALHSSSSKGPVKFRMPTRENLVPIRLDIELEEQRYKDAFTWNPTDPDSEITIFAKRTVKDLKLPPPFMMHIVQSIQTQLAEFRSYEGQDMLYTGDKIVPIKLDLRVNNTLIKDQFLWDMNNFDSDPEDFAKTFCDDLGIQDPEVGVSKATTLLSVLPFYLIRLNVDSSRPTLSYSLQPAVAFAIREQLYETAVQSVAAAREIRMSKKGRRSAEYVPARFLSQVLSYSCY